jgi:glycosyltransferase involved in cell wall biosynthesis
VNIAFLTPSFHPRIGGAETYSRSLMAGLAERGHDVMVVTSPVPGAPQREELDGVSVHRDGPPGRERNGLRAGWLTHSGKAIGKLLPTLPDVVLGEYEALAAAKWLARRSGTSFVALVHDVTTLSRRILCRGVVRGIARYTLHERLLSALRPDLVLAVSETTASVARRLVRAPVIVALSGADHVPEGPDADPDSLQVLFMGRLVRGKGLRDAVQAVHEIRTRIPEAELVVVGDGPEGRVPSWVRVVPGLPNRSPQLDRIVRSSAALAMPSLCEGAPLAMVEASARGVPYVAYDIPAVRERHGILAGGIVVPEGDVEALREAIHRLLVDRQFRSRLGGTGRDRTRARLRWAEASATVDRAIGLTLEGRTRAPDRGAEA